MTLVLGKNNGLSRFPDSGGPCADATVHNSDNSYSTTVASGGDLEIPDIDVEVNDTNGNTFSTTTEVAAVNLVINIPFSIAYERVIPPQVTSNRNGDSAYLKANGYFDAADTQILGLKPIRTDWFTLAASTPNIHGNTARFTATDGTQTYTGDGIVQDHLTGIEWLFDATYLDLGLASAGDADSLGADTFANCWTAVAASTYEGGNWRVPTTYDFVSVRLLDPSLIDDNNYLMDYAPFNIDTSGYLYWASDSTPSSTANMVRMNSDSSPMTFTGVIATNATVRLMICRWIP